MIRSIQSDPAIKENALAIDLKLAAYAVDGERG